MPAKPMNFEVDHLFICCSPGAPEGDTLTALGWIEGEPNHHPGQGTANRRFFFENLYLELLYVSNEEETRGPKAGPLLLWQRCTEPGASPFGILLRPACVSADAPADAAPFPAWQYRPDYLPPGLAIEVASETPLSEPALFYLPFAVRPSVADSAVNSAAGPNQAPSAGQSVNPFKVTSISIGLPDTAALSPGSLWLQEQGLVRFEHGAQFYLGLHGDWGMMQGLDLGGRLPLRLLP